MEKISKMFQGNLEKSTLKICPTFGSKSWISQMIGNFAFKQRLKIVEWQQLQKTVGKEMHRQSPIFFIFN